jgi:hypothetical protein
MGISISGKTHTISDHNSTISISSAISDSGASHLMIHSTDDRDRRRASVITSVHGDDPWRVLRQIVEAGTTEHEAMKAKWQRIKDA